jgi:hypothetical protein
LEAVGNAGGTERNIAMRDAYDARMWADHHQSFSASIGKAIAATMVALTKLNEIQFDAPWLKRSRVDDRKAIRPAR